MGAQPSQYPQGSIQIVLDKGAYYQGENITGKILLNIDKPFPGTALLLRIKGKETSAWSGKNNKSNSGNTIILSHQFLVYNFPQTFNEIGQYSFPFSLRLPLQIPASFATSTIINMATKYKVKAVFISEDPQVKSMRNVLELVLIPVPNENYGPLNGECMISMASCWGKKGSAQLKVQLNKSSFHDDEVAVIEVWADNTHCSSSIDGFDVKLIGKVAVKSNEGFEQIFTQNFIEQSFPAKIPAKTVTNTPIRLEFRMKQKNSICLPPSSVGLLNRNIYSLVVSPKSKPNAVELPIFIHVEGGSFPVNPQFPPNWAPKDMPLAAFEFSSGEAYQGKNKSNTNYSTLFLAGAKGLQMGNGLMNFYV